MDLQPNIQTVSDTQSLILPLHVGWGQKAGFVASGQTMANCAYEG
jgi:hypothetical protein